MPSLHRDDVMSIPTVIKYYSHNLEPGTRRTSELPEEDMGGRQSFLKKIWLDDSREIIDFFGERYPDSVDLTLFTAVGNNLSLMVRGKSNMLEHMLKNNLLSRLYTKGRGLEACKEYVAAIMRKVSHKYPSTRILEIGVGTDSTTGSVFNAIGNAYLSYTYTHISAGLFEKVSEKLTEHTQSMDFKTFNAEHPPPEQGFTESPYDISLCTKLANAWRESLRSLCIYPPNRDILSFLFNAHILSVCRNCWKMSRFRWQTQKSSQILDVRAEHS